jgi:hypothetical protein
MPRSGLIGEMDTPFRLCCGRFTALLGQLPASLLLSFQGWRTDCEAFGNTQKTQSLFNL